MAMGFAASAQDLPAWFEVGASTRANAEKAARANIAPADATRALIAAGDDASHSVQAVIRAYNTCDAVSASVGAAVRVDPSRAGDIVQGATASGRCPCSSESIWSQSRLQRRIRIEQRREPLQIAALCGCSAISAEAAVTAAPERTDDVIAAALLASRRAEAVVDSLGQVGAPTGPGALGESLVRVPERRCARDATADDAFQLGQLWQTGATDPGALTREERRCVDNDDDKKSDNDDLSLSSYLASADDRALVLYNGTDKAIDLASAQYQVDLYFPESNDPGRRVALTGRVEPGAYYVVAGRGAEPAWLERADQVVASKLLTPSEAVVLRRGIARDGCDCAQATVAGTVNGLGPAAKQWIEDQNDEGERRLVTADSVGGVRPETQPLDQWQGPLAAAPLQLAREAQACDADRRPEDNFQFATPWQVLADGQSPAAPRCAITPVDVLLAGYRAWTPPEQGQPAPRAVALVNATGNKIDLARDGYVLEVYAAGQRNPKHVLKLEGEVAAGAQFAVATRDVAAEQLPSAVQRSQDLAENQLDAVVLRRLATRSDQVCPLDVFAAARVVGSGPVVIAAGPPSLNDGEPRSDELPIDPDRGGDLASPN